MVSGVVVFRVARSTTVSDAAASPGDADVVSAAVAGEDAGNSFFDLLHRDVSRRDSCMPHEKCSEVVC